MSDIFMPINQQYCSSCGAPMMHTTAGWVKTCGCQTWTWTMPFEKPENQEADKLRARIAELENALTLIQMCVNAGPEASHPLRILDICKSVLEDTK